MTAADSGQMFVLLPAEGLRGNTSIPEHRSFLMQARPRVLAFAGEGSLDWEEELREVSVVDSLGESGAKLLRLDPGSVGALRAYQPGLRLVPVTYFTEAVAARPTLRASAKMAKSAKPGFTLSVKVVSAADGKPLARTEIEAFVNVAAGEGARAITDKRGVAELRFSSHPKKLERLYVYPRSGHWGLLRRRVDTTASLSVSLTPVDLGYQDCLRHFYKTGADGSNVRIGIVDSGIALDHPDLHIEGGLNAVTGEDPSDYGDNGTIGHGTHVAGIAAACGSPPTGARGIAPAAILRSYRVYGKRKRRAESFSIAKAILQATDDKCDIISLSLTGQPDVTVEEAIEDAWKHGTLVIAAAGNDGRKPVSFPARTDFAIAVSALGRKGTFPVDAVESGDIAKPWGHDDSNFIGSFSNVGPEIDLTAPGVAIISTLPGGYGVMTGTSMACPAACGLAARLLSQNTKIFKQKRDIARATALAKLLLQSARTLGFEASFQGRGLPA